MFTITTYTQRGIERQALLVAWDDIPSILGRRHDGTLDDDLDMRKWLRENQAPAWSYESDEGATDEYGWYMLGAPIAGEDSE